MNVLACYHTHLPRKVAKKQLLSFYIKISLNATAKLLHTSVLQATLVIPFGMT